MYELMFWEIQLGSHVHIYPPYAKNIYFEVSKISNEIFDMYISIIHMCS
jgi:hypothetical protein